VVSQIVLTVILLIGAGVFIRTIRHFQSIDAGFDPNVLLLSSDFFLSGAFEVGTEHAEKRARIYYSGSLDQIRALPGIRSASWAEDLPFDRRGSIREEIRPEEADAGQDNWLAIRCNVISTDYFKTFKIPILQGRDFRDSESNSPTGAVIVNETLARRYWPGRSPLGRRIRMKDTKPELWEVVGVAKDCKYGTPWEEAQPYAYFPYWQFPLYLHMDLHVSAAGNPMHVANSIQKACKSLNPDVTMRNPRLMSERTASLLSQERSTASVLLAFGSLALILAATGLYGIISYAVAQRAHEFGIRRALGAQNADIIKPVIREGMTLALAGLAIGLPCSMALSRFIESRLHGMSPVDPFAYASVSLLCVSVMVLAALLPARRAAQSPIAALRFE
jgi:predicted permease